MYVVYCQNKPKSEHIVSEFIETYFEVSGLLQAAVAGAPRKRKVLLSVFAGRSSGSSWVTGCSSTTCSSSPFRGS